MKDIDHVDKSAAEVITYYFMQLVVQFVFRGTYNNNSVTTDRDPLPNGDNLFSVRNGLDGITEYNGIITFSISISSLQ
jgi:hypothetical protein